MKKHSEWRKGRRIFRRVMRAAAAIDRKDTARAEWFNNRFDEIKKSNPFGYGYAWFIDHRMDSTEWPELSDMFIRVEDADHMDASNDPGEYQVVGIAILGDFDAMLRVTNVDTKEEGYLWFPRHGQTVVPCKEYT